MTLDKRILNLNAIAKYEDKHLGVWIATPYGEIRQEPRNGLFRLNLGEAWDNQFRDHSMDAVIKEMENKCNIRITDVAKRFIKREVQN